MARPALAELAERVGIAAEYVPAGGGAPVAIPDETRVAVLAALGIEAATESAARSSLAALDAASRARGVPGALRVAQGARSLSLQLPAIDPAVKLEAVVRAEDGSLHEVAVRRGRTADGATSLRLALPVLPAGYHRLHVRAGAGREASTTLLATPARCFGVSDALGGDRAFGIWANLYALRSRDHGLGIGDLGALRELVRFAAREGAEFIGLSPLHALRNRGHDVSPYSPSSRLFRNAMYVDVESVPELAESEEARSLLGSPALRAELAQLRDARWIDHGRIAARQAPLLLALHRAFAQRHRDRDGARGAAYRAYRAEQGAALERFAVFQALEDWLAGQGHPRDFRGWPAEYRDPAAPAVAEFARRNAEAIDLHAWVQFELDRQLEQVSREARAGGMRIGLYSDLALGSSASGFDAWAEPALSVVGMTVGAPPDAYTADGQDWGFPPLSPIRLEERGFADWVRLVRANLRHAGALRIDHVLGLVRQWWVPRGMRATLGAYLRYPLEELLAVLAIESRRARALVIGEDLGTIPPGLATRLAARGILSLRVTLFERDRRGAFRRASGYSSRALASMNTHDWPPLAGLWTGRDLELRRERGLLDESALESAQAERVRLRAALLSRLRREDVLPEDEPDPALPRLARAVHEFLCKTPSPLIGVALGDLTAEQDPVNLPGVPMERYPSWSRRMDVAVEDLTSAPQVREALAGVKPLARR